MHSYFWCKHGEGEIHGPIDKEKLRDMVREGGLARNDRVWREGLTDWIAAAQVSGLFPSPPPPNSAKPHPLGDSLEPPENFDEQSAGSLDSRMLDEVSGEPEDSGDRPGNDVSKQSHLAEESRLEGVGGWLAFFCVLLIIMTPVFTVAPMAGEWYQWQPVLEKFPTLKTAFFSEMFFLLAIVAYGFVTGLMIWQGRDDGKQLAERYLKVRIGVVVGTDLLIVWVLSDLPTEIFSALIDEAVITVFWEVLFFAFWLAYFRKSKRVAATYGK